MIWGCRRDFFTTASRMSKRVAVAKVTEFEDGSCKAVAVNDERVAVFRVGNAFYAIEDRCSHADVPLSEGWIDAEKNCVSCPWHGAQFDLATGAALNLPAVLPVKAFEVAVEGDSVVVGAMIPTPQ